MQSPVNSPRLQYRFQKHSPFCKLHATSRNESNIPSIHFKLRDLKHFNEIFIASRKNIFSFSQLVLSNEIHKLIVSNNNIQDFIGLPNLPNLESLDISENPITSLKAFPVLPNLHEINLYQTPLSQTPHFRLALICLCGNSLRIINGERITNSERQLSAQYLPGTLSLLRLGWTLSYPPPTDAEILKLQTSMLSQNTISSDNSRNLPIIVKTLYLNQSEIYNKRISQQQETIKELQNQIRKLESSLRRLK